jgi:hypothetical protein
LLQHGHGSVPRRSLQMWHSSSGSVGGVVVVVVAMWAVEVVLVVVLVAVVLITHGSTGTKGVPAKSEASRGEMIEPWKAPSLGMRIVGVVVVVAVVAVVVAALVVSRLEMAGWVEDMNMRPCSSVWTDSFSASGASRLAPCSTSTVYAGAAPNLDPDHPGSERSEALESGE